MCEVLGLIPSTAKKKKKKRERERKEIKRMFALNNLSIKQS
jgi:hypothetical protein